MKKLKFFKGTVAEFLEWLILLKRLSDTSAEDKKKYDEIKKSVIYISEYFDTLPKDLSDFTGAIYAHGAIIAGGDSGSCWEDDITDISE